MQSKLPEDVCVQKCDYGALGTATDSKEKGEPLIA